MRIRTLKTIKRSNKQNITRENYSILQCWLLNSYSNNVTCWYGCCSFVKLVALYLFLSVAIFFVVLKNTNRCFRIYNFTKFTNKFFRFWETKKLNSFL